MRLIFVFILFLNFPPIHSLTHHLSLVRYASCHFIFYITKICLEHSVSIKKKIPTTDSVFYIFRMCNKILSIKYEQTFLFNMQWMCSMFASVKKMSVAQFGWMQLILAKIYSSFPSDTTFPIDSYHPILFYCRKMAENTTSSSGSSGNSSLSMSQSIGEERLMVMMLLIWINLLFAPRLKVCNE